MICQPCGGKGWLLTEIVKDNEPVCELQRCDICEKFKDDLEAASAYFLEAGREYDLARVELTKRWKPK